MKGFSDMLIRVSLTAVLLLIPGVVDSQVEIKDGFMKCQDYIERSEGQRSMYAMGIVDGMLIAPLFGAPADAHDLQTLGKCVGGMSDKQVAAIIEKYVRDRPEIWHEPLHAAVFRAMMAACKPKFTR